MTDDVTSGWFDARIVTGAHPASLVTRSDKDAIAAHLDTYAMSGALVSAMASWLHDPLGGNAEASAVAHSLADRGVLACWTAVPPTPGELHSLGGLVDQAVAEGVAAFRLHPRSHGFSPVVTAMHELYAALDANGLPLCVDLTEIDWHHLDHIATRFPTLPIVVSNLGYRQLRNLWAAVRDHENLYVDLVDFAGHQAIEWLAARGLADRLLFASGLGLRDPGESIVRLAWSGLDDNTVALIGAGNADRLFGVRRTATADGPRADTAHGTAAAVADGPRADTANGTAAAMADGRGAAMPDGPRDGSPDGRRTESADGPRTESADGRRGGLAERLGGRS